MPYLTDQEKTKHRVWLETWRSPAAMKDHVEKVMDYMASDTYGISKALFNQAGVDFILEAFAAARFSAIRGAVAVRLIPDPRPDFEVRTHQGQEAWELTEADVPGRRRGQEYSEAVARVDAGFSAVEDDSVENWHARADHAAPSILRLAVKKAGKSYTPDTRLLIYLNIDEFGIRHQEIEAAMLDATAPARDAFAEVWVLWKSQAIRLWNGGQADFQSHGPAPDSVT